MVVCHKDMTGKRGGECCGNEYTPFSNGIFMFWWEKNLHYLIFDVIMLCH